MKNNLSPECALLRDLLLFEQWLRFYFITEEGEALVLHVPENVALRVRENASDLADLMDDLTDRQLEAADALAVVFAAAAEMLGEGGPAPEALFSDPALQTELGLFRGWVQEHERELDEKLYGFRAWLQRFDDWQAARSPD